MKNPIDRYRKKLIKEQFLDTTRKPRTLKDVHPDEPPKPTVRTLEQQEGVPERECFKEDIYSDEWFDKDTSYVANLLLECGKDDPFYIAEEARIRHKWAVHTGSAKARKAGRPMTRFANYDSPDAQEALEKHRAQAAVTSRRWHSKPENRQRKAMHNAKWRAANPQKYREYLKKYVKKNYLALAEKRRKKYIEMTAPLRAKGLLPTYRPRGTIVTTLTPDAQMVDLGEAVYLGDDITIARKATELH